jgi:hypothetical protein
MKIFDKEAMKRLSFPDSDVEKVQFSRNQKSLKIFMKSGWLETDNGHQLGKGVLCFTDWKKLTISEFNPSTEKWSELDQSSLDFLKDICEVKFFNSSICLYGFGKKVGHWMEWKIQKTKMHAEFES